MEGKKEEKRSSRPLAREESLSAKRSGKGRRLGRWPQRGEGKRERWGAIPSGTRRREEREEAALADYSVTAFSPSVGSEKGKRTTLGAAAPAFREEGGKKETNGFSCSTKPGRGKKRKDTLVLCCGYSIGRGGEETRGDFQAEKGGEEVRQKFFVAGRGKVRERGAYPPDTLDCNRGLQSLKGEKV